MLSFGYYILKFICLTFFGVFNPKVAEAVGPFIDLEIVGFQAFITWILVVRPRMANFMLGQPILVRKHQMI
ncbi:NS7c protein [Sparrow coronavirus HKU17]|uniref:NS7c protein n=1 Tax=Sparrow coronavirus HKU17 TaxID=1159906 RepID=UPI00025719C4|nr:NS7c protein [Sparrow coronavirus HKU17]AFD29215.1 NS7b protein [Sparrow coronavirus HKU17]